MDGSSESGFSSQSNAEWKAPVTKESDQTQQRAISEKTSQGVVSPDKTQSAWSRLSNFLKRDKQLVDAQYVAKTDHISQEQAEFRAAGNRLTANTENNFRSTKSTFENTGSTSSEADDLAFMRNFKGKGPETQIIPPQDKTTEVIDVISNRAVVEDSRVLRPDNTIVGDETILPFDKLE